MKESRKIKAGTLGMAWLLMVAPLFLTGAAAWEGSAAVAPAGSIFRDTFVIATNSFPRHTTVDVTNLENGRTVRVVVAQNLTTSGLLATLSRDAAESLGITGGAARRVRIIQPSDDIAFAHIRRGLLPATGDEVHVEAAALTPAVEIPGAVEGLAALEPPADESDGMIWFADEVAGTADDADEDGMVWFADEIAATDDGTPEDATVWFADASRPAEAADSAEPEPLGDGIPEWILPEWVFADDTVASAEAPGIDWDEIAWGLHDLEIVWDEYPTDLGFADIEPATPAISVAEVVPEPVPVVETTLRLVPATERLPPADEPAIPPHLIIPPIGYLPSPAARPPTHGGFSPFGSVPLVETLERGMWYVQIGAFAHSHRVEAEIGRMETSHPYPILVQNIGTDTSPTFRVLLGPLNMGEGAAVLRRVRSVGNEDAFMRRG